MTPARLMGGSNRWRMTVLDRYSVGGPECGVVATAGSFMQAQALARVHAAECAAGAQVEFYDRLAIAGDLETAAGALEAPAKLQQILAAHPLRTTALLPRRLRRRRGRHGCLVEGGDLLPGKLPSGP